MNEPRTEELRLHNQLTAIALIVLAGISGIIVYSCHNFDWPVFLATVVIGGVFGYTAGGLVGVRLFATLATMAFFGGIFEGVYRGWEYAGLLGAILGGFIGIVAAFIVAVWLPLMLTCLVLNLCGIDPFANLHSTEEEKRESP